MGTGVVGEGVVIVGKGKVDMVNNGGAVLVVRDKLVVVIIIDKFYPAHLNGTV